MTLEIIDLYDSDADQKKKKNKEEADNIKKYLQDRQTRKQVININGEVVTI